MRLWCVSRYQSSLGRFSAGEEIVIDDEPGELLLRDSPGSFSLVEPGPVKGKTAKASKTKEDGVIAFDVETSPVQDLKAFAEGQGIDLEGVDSEDDMRAAIALALEERAKEKVESAPAAGTRTSTRPQRRGRTR